MLLCCRGMLTWLYVLPVQDRTGGTTLLPVLLSTQTQLPKPALAGNVPLELQRLGFLGPWELFYWDLEHVQAQESSAAGLGSLKWDTLMLKMFLQELLDSHQRELGLLWTPT